MTALTLYATTQLDSILTNAAQAVTATGAGGSTTNHTAIGTNSGWGELGFGGNPAWASGGAAGSASGYGVLWDATTLEGQTVAAGTWSLKTSISTSAAGSTETGTLELLLYKYNVTSQTYTQIGSATIGSATYSTTPTAVTLSASLSAIAFATGDRLYLELWFDSTGHSGTPVNLLVTTSNSASLGYAGAGELDTPGYSPTGGGSPALSTSAASLPFSAIAGGANPASENDTLSETAGYATAWTSSITYGSGSGWLSITPTAGSLSANGSATISVSCTTGSLSVGTYSATVTFIATTGGAQASISVSFVVASPGPPPATNLTVYTRDGKRTLSARDGKLTLSIRGN